MKRKIGIGIIGCLIVMSMNFLTVFAQGGIEKETQEKGGTAIEAGVVVDYMGKLQFLVLDKNTSLPIEGASIELYVKALDKYVLFGMSDENGRYEVDIAYAEDGYDVTEQYGQKGTNLNDKQVYFEDNQIKWKVYKKGYLKYPETGELMLDTLTLPYQQIVYLYKPTPTETVQPTNPPNPTGSANPTRPTRPFGVKTGDTNARAIYYAVAGLCFSAVLLTVVFVVRKAKRKKEKVDVDQ